MPWVQPLAAELGEGYDGGARQSITYYLGQELWEVEGEETDSDGHAKAANIPTEVVLVQLGDAAA